MKTEKLLIICYSFPPAPGIGGRRWAKFANYIHRSGIDVQVLMARYDGTATSDWYKDTLQLHEEKRVHQFDTQYPSILQTIPDSLFLKIKYHLTRIYLKWKIKGNFYDRSSLCENELLEMAEKWVEKGYTNIIISVGPFMYSKHLLKIKDKFPEVKLFLDVRDPWTNNKTAFGYSTLTPQRFRIEKEAEKEVALGYDRIITVADEMGAYFVKEYGVSSEKVFTIKNGFDPADFIGSNAAQNEKKILLFTGNLYQKAENSFLMLVDQLKKMKTDDPDFFKHYECHFYGEIHPSFLHYFSKDINLYFHGKISLKEVFEKIGQATACMLFLTDDLNFSFSTKFYEYLSQKKPIIVFSLPGKTGAFVEEHHLGMQANGNNLSEIINRIGNHEFYKETFDISEFEVSHLAGKLLKCLGLID